MLRTSGANRRRQARPSGSPRPTAVAETDRSSTAVRPPSRGWAKGASGWISSTPCAARSTVRKNGDVCASGRIVEQTSWRNPGSVSACGPHPAADVGGGFVDPDRAPDTGQRDRRGESVGPGADDDRVDRSVGLPRHRVGSPDRNQRNRVLGATAARVVAARSSVTASTLISSRSRAEKSATVRSWS